MYAILSSLLFAALGLITAIGLTMKIIAWRRWKENENRITTSIGFRQFLLSSAVTESSDGFTQAKTLLTFIYVSTLLWMWLLYFDATLPSFFSQLWTALIR